MGDGVRDLGSLDGQVHTTTLQVDNQQEPTAQHMELCSMLRGSLEGSLGENGYMYIVG